MSIRAAVEWLANTEWSIALHESQYAYAIIESIHVWALCLFVGFAVLLDLRLIGVIFRDVPVSDVARRLLPWTRAGFAVMVVSGILLFYAIPLRTYLNIFFRIKAVLLILAGSMPSSFTTASTPNCRTGTGACRRRVRRGSRECARWSSGRRSCSRAG